MSHRHSHQHILQNIVDAIIALMKFQEQQRGKIKKKMDGSSDEQENFISPVYYCSDPENSVFSRLQRKAQSKIYHFSAVLAGSDQISLKFAGGIIFKC